jgi:Flp pilus assembly pilin Flp
MTRQFGWRRACKLAQRFVRDDSGIAVTEYGLLIALIAILLIAVVSVFASAISSWFTAKTGSIISV